MAAAARSRTSGRPDTYAQSGFYVSDTRTPGHVCRLSNEHHIRIEIGSTGSRTGSCSRRRPRRKSAKAPTPSSLEIRNSRNILVANYHGYRVTRTEKPAPAAVRLDHVAGIRFRNVHVNAESGLAALRRARLRARILRASKFPYENAIQSTSRTTSQVREREFAVLDVPADPAPAPARGTGVEKLADGFWSISGGAVGPDGTLYFVDRKFNRIYGWSRRAKA